MLGFAGVLVALGPAAGRFGMAGKMFAVAAAGWAVSAFFPRTHPMSDLETMHRDYPMWDERLTKRLLLNASVKAVYEARWSLQQRVARLQISIGFGALSVLMLVWDILRA